MVRCVPSILLLGVFALLGSGSLEHVHNLLHRHEHASHDTLDNAGGSHVPAAPTHDESNCSVHRALHQPIVAGAWAPAEFRLGLLPEVIRAYTSVSYLPFDVSPVDCTGPPGC